VACSINFAGHFPPGLGGVGVGGVGDGGTFTPDVAFFALDVVDVSLKSKHLMLPPWKDQALHAAFVEQSSQHDVTVRFGSLYFFTAVPLNATPCCTVPGHDEGEAVAVTAAIQKRLGIAYWAPPAVTSR